MAVGYRQFESEFGFKSPFFEVDDLGNVTLRSITYVDEQTGTELTPNYTLTETQGSVNFFVSELQQINPTLELTRGETYTFQLNLVALTFSLTNNGSYYDTGLRYTVDGEEYVEENAAQLKKTGYIVFDVPGNAPDTLAIEDPGSGVTIPINIIDPVFTGNGNFNNLTATGNINFIGNGSDIIISPTGTGTLEINPSSGSINNVSLSATTLSASSTVSLNAVNSNVSIIATLNGKVVLDSGITGTLDNIEIGKTTAAKGSFTELNATAGTINNVAIGSATGSFTSLEVSDTPVNVNDVTNKGYVDGNSLVFAIAFGL